MLLVAQQLVVLAGVGALLAPAFALPTTIDHECNTPACELAADQVREFMDPTADPCDDFYDYACGRLLKEAELPTTNKIPHVKRTVDDLRKQLKSELLTLILEPIVSTDSKPIAMAKKYFTDCLDNEAREAIGYQPLLELIDQIGGWPLISDDIAERTTGKWWELAEKFAAAGVNGDWLVKVDVQTDVLQSHRNTIKLNVPCDESTNKNLLNITEVSAELGAEFTIDQQNVEEFSTKLCSIETANHFKNISLSALQNRHPYVNWTNYINSQLPSNVRVSASEEVRVDSKYLENLGKLLAQSHDRVVANYLVWKVVQQLMPFAHNALTSKTRSTKARNKNTCLESITLNMPHVLDALYVRRHSDVRIRYAVNDMANRVRRVMTENLYSNVDWVDPETKRRAVQKMNAIRQLIAFPDELLDDAQLEEIYADVNVYNLNFFDATRRLLTWRRMNELDKLHKPIDRARDWLDFKMAEVNAFYSPLKNMIVIPGGYIQGQFSLNQPNYINFASIGTAIGHELTHAFDNSGRQYDEHGSFSYWWTTESDLRYDERAACLLNQYSHFIDPVTRLTLKAMQTQPDDISDNGGVHLVYKTYQQWVAAHHIEPRLPGIDLTPNQLFWLSYGQRRCSKPDYASAIDLRNSDGHSPNRFRVLGPLMNSQAFAKDFACPVGSPMNPPNKCRFVKD